MKILFSPSETKSELGGDTRICKRNFIFADLYEKRLQMLRAYADFVDKASEAELCKLFGLKKWDAALRENIFEKGCAKALLRYTGTAYRALGYASLSPRRAGVCRAKYDNFFKPFRPRAGRRRAAELQAQAGRKIWRHRRGEILSR
ncbi:peroxide stress protein YaaA [uncultured Campylobacter sp.]|uniref:peroxide stress protein YaaA n=1 Tax=uncultured Campylobacter sp. TaxID=218934 RepID=UPI002617ECA5|nr:peroxide stress protein YaaA [uncultured Campylobacter sp.]